MVQNCTLHVYYIHSIIIFLIILINIFFVYTLEELDKERCNSVRECIDTNPNFIYTNNSWQTTFEEIIDIDTYANKSFLFRDSFTGGFFSV